MTDGGSYSPKSKHSTTVKDLVSQRQKLAWQDPIVRERRISAIKRVYSDPALRQAQREKIISDPVTRARRDAAFSHTDDISSHPDQTPRASQRLARVPHQDADAGRDRVNG